MGGALFAFLAVPGLTAIIAGYVLADWKLAAAVAAGGFALLFVLLPLGPPYIFALPAVSGLAVSGAVLVPFLRLANDPTVWGRMTVALVAALVAGGGLLLLTFGGR